MAQQSQGPHGPAKQPIQWAPGQTSASYLQGGAAIPPGQPGNPGMPSMGGAMGNYGQPMQAAPGSSTGANWLTGPPGSTAKGTTASPSADVLKQMFQLKQQQGNQVGQWSNIGGQMQFQPQNQMQMAFNQGMR